MQSAPPIHSEADACATGIPRLWLIRALTIQDVGADRQYKDDHADDSVVLLEAPFDPSRRQNNSVLLTIDLTRAVADEAIARKDSVVVAYRMHLMYA